MNVFLAQAIIGGPLGVTTKMPCYTGQGMPVSTCKRGSELGQIQGSVCHSCYAKRGKYNCDTVQNRMWERWYALMTAHDDGRLDEYEEAFTKILLEYVA